MATTTSFNIPLATAEDIELQQLDRSKVKFVDTDAYKRGAETVSTSVYNVLGGDKNSPAQITVTAISRPGKDSATGTYAVTIKLVTSQKTVVDDVVTGYAPATFVIGFTLPGNTILDELAVLRACAAVMSVLWESVVSKVPQTGALQNLAYGDTSIIVTS